jgi:hypothetical protein
MNRLCGPLGRQSAWWGTIGEAALALSPPVLLIAQDRADAVDVPRHHRQGHITLESIEAVVGTAIQTMNLQGSFEF